MIGLKATKKHTYFTNGDWKDDVQLLNYNANQVALLSIGIWNGHSCYSATDRIHKIAKEANVFISRMRKLGCHIIHCGSYNNYHCKLGKWDETNLRKNIRGKPKAKLQDKGITIPPLPIDDSDGGYEPADKNMEYNKKNVAIHPDIEIDYDNDCISDYSKEILNYLYDKGVKLIVAFGTHTNMCILDKPYGIKHYIRYGFPVVLVENLCDSMYNPKMPPFISHQESNKCMTEWIQKYVCPTINSNEVIDYSHKTVYVDIDDTIFFGKGEKKYEEPCPNQENIHFFNKKYDDGYNIVYWTARGSLNGKDWYQFTKNQLDECGVRYTMLLTGKPSYDFFVDDKNINITHNLDKTSI